ncbi:probable cytoplasmic aconitate hydratase [Littorina saxatilis]|uniref:probable cytoplasmic aconitate hydratase n=1 Tax=Littorina saxatilis TaxID=31220 RepID=UPI0038B5C47E
MCNKCARVAENNPFKSTLQTVKIGAEECRFYDLSKLDAGKLKKLPFSVRVLLESAVRNCDNFHVLEKDVQNILNWSPAMDASVEIPFKPARVILQDFTGVPVVVDFAAMREAVKRLGGDPHKINSICPADLVIDHSVQVDVSRRIVVALLYTLDEHDCAADLNEMCMAC